MTGAAGFLGSRVLRMPSQQRQYRVIATDVVQSSRADELARLPRVEFRAMDLRDREALTEAVDDDHRSPSTSPPYA